MSSILKLQFLTSGNTKFTLMIDGPKPNLTENEVKSVMNLIVEENIFKPKGMELVDSISASVIETTTDSLF